MDKEAFVVDQTGGPTDGYIYMTYSDFRAPTGIKCTRSTDGGYTWREPVPVFLGGGSQGSFPVVDNGGTLFVAYRANGAMRVSRSGDQGASFEDVANIPYTEAGVPYMDRSSDFPQLAVDLTDGPRAGWLYIVFHANVGGVLRPMLSRSENNGDTWTTPAPINTDTVAAPHWWASVAVGLDGNVNVIYLSRELNPGTGLTDTFYARSTDGGNTFTNTRASDVSGNWQTVLHDGGFTYAGDYIRAITDGFDVLATWADARNGDPDVYFTRISAP